jgi:hypothetical protein
VTELFFLSPQTTSKMLGFTFGGLWPWDGLPMFRVWERRSHSVINKIMRVPNERWEMVDVLV